MFDLYSQLMIPFHMTTRSMTLNETFILKMADFDSGVGGIRGFHSSMR